MRSCAQSITWAATVSAFTSAPNTHLRISTSQSYAPHLFGFSPGAPGVQGYFRHGFRVSGSSPARRARSARDRDVLLIPRVSGKRLGISLKTIFQLALLARMRDSVLHRSGFFSVSIAGENLGEAPRPLRAQRGDAQCHARGTRLRSHRGRRASQSLSPWPPACGGVKCLPARLSERVCEAIVHLQRRIT